MSDSQTTLGELKRLVANFVERRDWHRFHSPKNLSMSMAIEAAELMEHFQWLSAEQSRDVIRHPPRLAAVTEELADVLCYVLAMANELGLDLSTAVRQKMARNEQKYPVEQYRGRFGPEDVGTKGERGKMEDTGSTEAGGRPGLGIA
jgi:NTP pyrophosphatase (non-canonical NTP hydrolase)